MANENDKVSGPHDHDHDAPTTALHEVTPVDYARVDPDPEIPGDQVGEVQADTPNPAAGDRLAAQKEIEGLKAQLEFSQAKSRELMEKLRDEHEKLLRTAADLDNFKKRAQKEKEEVQKFGAERLLKDLLPVVDNLDRALEASAKTSDFESLRQGVAMTRKQFEDALGRHGVKGFSALGQPFDPHLHEAMQQVETAEVPANHVAAELVRGYTLNDRLVRPALVVVAKAPADGSSAGPEGNEGARPDGGGPGSAEGADGGSSGGS